MTRRDQYACMNGLSFSVGLAVSLFIGNMSQGAVLYTFDFRHNGTRRYIGWIEVACHDTTNYHNGIFTVDGFGIDHVKLGFQGLANR